MSWKTLLGVVSAPFGGTLGLIAVGALAASALTYHFLAVNSAWHDGYARADEKCRVNASLAREKTETLYQLRAQRLRAQLDADRERDAKRADDAEQASRSLEDELQALKTDPVCWPEKVVKEIQR